VTIAPGYRQLAPLERQHLLPSLLLFAQSRSSRGNVCARGSRGVISKKDESRAFASALAVAGCGAMLLLGMGWQAAELEQGLIVTLRDGVAVQVEIYGDLEKALEAAGLRE
jgi:hypothetical protein